MWGLDGVALTPRLFGLPVPLVVLLLHLVPFILMQPFLFRAYPRIARMGRGGWISLLLVALSGGLLGTLAIVKALFLVNFNQLSVVVLLQKLQPVFAILLAALVLGERMRKEFFIWAFLAVVGAYGLTFGLRLPASSTGSGGVEAAVWAVVAALAFGCATVLGKRLLDDLDFKAATFARYGLTSALALVYLGLSGTGLPLESVGRVQWILVLAIGLTTGSGAIFVYYYGLGRVRASVATICELCLPLSAVLFDYLLNDSVLGPWQWVGAGLMLTAIVRISWYRGIDRGDGAESGAPRGYRNHYGPRGVAVRSASPAVDDPQGP
jgi:drug/metabolite transporter (DMT)-like permease